MYSLTKTVLCMLISIKTYLVADFNTWLKIIALQFLHMPRF